MRQKFNFRAYFFFKNRKIQKITLHSTPTYRGTPLSWWQGPPCFPLGFSLQWESQFDKEHLFLVSIIAGCWKWAIYNGSWSLGYCSHLVQKRWEFLYPSEKRKGMGKKPPSTIAERKIELGLAICRPVFLSHCRGLTQCLSAIKNSAPTFSLGAKKGVWKLCRKINLNWSSSPWRM